MGHEVIMNEGHSTDGEATGLTGDLVESNGLALADPTCRELFLLLLAARDRVPQQRSTTAMKARGLALVDPICL